jgi:hypothetical protein
MVLHFHVTPVGGSKEMARTFLRNRYALVSIEYPTEVDIVKEVCKGYIIDNGAYTAWRNKRFIDFKKYINFIEQHRTDRLMWAFIPDVIDGTVEENDNLCKAWPSHLPGVPVYHLHEPIDRLVRLAAQYSIVALGSSGNYATPGVQKWWKRISKCLDCIVDSRGVTVTNLHGLRMLSPSLVSKIPFYSVDSSMVGRNSYGESKRRRDTTRLRAAELLANRIERHQSPAAWTKHLFMFEGL